MQQAEILAFAGLRIDGRKCDEIRRLECKLGVKKQSDGSCYLEQVIMYIFTILEFSYLLIIF